MRFPHYKPVADKAASPPLQLPEHALKNAADWRGYVAEDDLAAAVNVAIMLGQPLLLTGPPGTGKTQLAYHVSNQFGWDDPYVFEAKSTSTYRDLWYTYDALGRFRAKEIAGAVNSTAAPDQQTNSAEAVNYLEYNALGKAILRSRKREDIVRYLREGKYMGGIRRTNGGANAVDRSDVHDGPKPSVVLIDEIDKAPRDFPNDILRELEELYFRVPEIDLRPIAADPSYRPFVIVTSNSEKNLPPAFLRRCTFFYIQTPVGKKLLQILSNRVGELAEDDPFYGQTVAFFEKLQKSGMEQKPGTAELIAWVSFLRRKEIKALRGAGAEERVTLKDALSTMAKSQDDLSKAAEVLDAFLVGK